MACAAIIDSLIDPGGRCIVHIQVVKTPWLQRSSHTWGRFLTCLSVEHSETLHRGETSVGVDMTMLSRTAKVSKTEEPDAGKPRVQDYAEASVNRRSYRERPQEEEK